MNIWKDIPLKYTHIGILMNLVNGDGLFPPNKENNEPSQISKKSKYIICPACNRKSGILTKSVDDNYNNKIYCSNCQTYSPITPK